MNKSKEKGKLGEREVVHLLKRYGFVAERGQQYHGRGDAPDVKHNMLGVHIEVKRTEQFLLWAALEQARGDMDDGDIPVVFHRKNGKNWVVVLDATAFLDLMKEIHAL